MNSAVVPGVIRLGTEIVNWYVVEDGGRLTAVDAGLPGYVSTLESDLAAHGHSVADIEAVVLTHSDGDHFGMAATMRDAGARVLIHRDDNASLRKPGPKKGDGAPITWLTLMWRPAFWRFMGHMARAGGGRPTPIENAETFADGQVLDVPGSPRVVHTPGHTDGHCALLFERHQALFVGDELCTWHPLSGERGPRLMPRRFDVSGAQCVEALAKLEPLQANTILPGPWRPVGGHARRGGRTRPPRTGSVSLALTRSGARARACESRPHSLQGAGAPGSTVRAWRPDDSGSRPLDVSVLLGLLELEAADVDAVVLGVVGPPDGRDVRGAVLADGGNTASCGDVVAASIARRTTRRPPT